MSYKCTHITLKQFALYNYLASFLDVHWISCNYRTAEVFHEDILSLTEQTRESLNRNHSKNAYARIKHNVICISIFVEFGVSIKTGTIFVFSIFQIFRLLNNIPHYHVNKTVLKWIKTHSIEKILITQLEMIRIHKYFWHNDIPDD